MTVKYPPKYSFLPGHGWIAQLMAKLPPNVRDKVRSWALFAPHDFNDLWPSPRARVTYPGVDRIKGYRYPAPGSRPLAVVPLTENEDKIYDIKYFSRDTRRKPRTVYSWTPSNKRVALPPSPEPPKALGSPGNKNPAVLAYDPTGLRSAMSATHAEMDKSIEKYMPNHLCRYEWEKDEEKILADLKAKGLPPIPGKRTKFNLPKLAREFRW